MKTNVVVIGTLLLLAAQCIGQNLVPINPPAIVRGFADQSLIIAKFDVQNVGNNPLNVNVRRDVIMMAKGTESQVCWGPVCYPPWVSVTPVPSLIPAGGIDTTFGGYYNPLGVIGKSTIQYTFYDQDNQSDSVTVVIDFEAVGPPFITGSQTYCAGDSTVLDAGAGYDSYNWSTGSTSQMIKVPAGTYYCKVTLHGEMRSTDTVTVIQSTALTVVITGSQEYCEGDSVVLDAGPGYDNYQWSNGPATRFNYAGAGTYTVDVSTTSGCSGASPAFTVQENPLPTVPIISWNNTILTATSAGYYHWYFNDYAVYGEHAQTMQPDSNGSYKVLICDTASCCCVFSNSIDVMNTGISEKPADNRQVFLYPNPAKNFTSVNTTVHGTFSLYNSVGELVRSIVIDQTAAPMRLSLSDLKAGIYIYSLAGGAYSTTGKLIVY